MENSFQTSFIPKKPIIPTNNFRPTTKSTTSISTVVSVFILIVMLIASGGLYLYKDYLTKNVASASADLLKIQGSFDPDTIQALESYDLRTSIAKEILGTHVVLSPLFELLNKLTLTSVQFTKFSHKTIDGVFSVEMSGIARDYKSIALQADIFSKDSNGMIKDVIFSNLTKDRNNYVTFNVQFLVDPELLSYTKNLNIKPAENPNIQTNPVEQAVIPADNNQSLLPGSNNIQ